MKDMDSAPRMTCGNDDVRKDKDTTYLQDHSTQLRCQEELLALGDQGVNHKVFPHIWDKN
jgi:hypothetical protein